MRILLIGDPHYKADNLDLMTKAEEEIVNVMNERKVDSVIIMGDTLNTHERVLTPVQAQAVKFIKRIARDRPVTVEIGNHDMTANTSWMSDVHSLTALKGWPNVTIVDETYWDRDNNFIHVPYVAPGRFAEALVRVEYDPETATKHPDFIFCHQERRDCIMGMQVSKSGDLWKSTYPQVFSGHIHEYQVIENWTYVGTFYQQNYGESPDKALMLLEITGRDEKDRPTFTTERIRLKSVPVLVTVHLNSNELEHFADKIPAEGQVRVIIRLDESETKTIESNPYYMALESTVAKVVKKVVSNKASLAENMIDQLKTQGRLSAEREQYSIVDIVTGMLSDDLYALHLWQSEILSN